MNIPIGQLKVKHIVYCKICNSKYIRNLKVNIYNENEVDSKKKELKNKVIEKYTCKACRSITNSL